MGSGFGQQEGSGSMVHMFSSVLIYFLEDGEVLTQDSSWPFAGKRELYGVLFSCCSVGTVCIVGVDGSSYTIIRF